MNVLVPQVMPVGVSSGQSRRASRTEPQLRSGELSDMAAAAVVKPVVAVQQAYAH
jgi:hypothetical protein